MNEKQQFNELDKIGVRFDQFIIAVNGALIAYSIKQIEDEIFSIKLIPLGLAIVCWSLSFYFGISSIRRLISTRILGVFKDRNEIKNNPKLIQMARENFNKVADLANKNNKKMFLFLYVGCVFYILWQIIEMYLRTVHNVCA